MKKYTIGEWSSDISPDVWACVKRYRMLRLRDRYEFDGEFRARHGVKRRYFAGEKSDSRFCEVFDSNGRPIRIEFYGPDGECTAQIEFLLNPAKWC